VISSHLLEYPYSFFALAREVRDDKDLTKRILETVQYLTPVS
jgi:hypothetical protein